MKYTQYSFALLLILSVMSACNQKGESAQNPMMQERIIPVNVEKVTEELVSNVVHYPASVVALNETEIRAEVNGYITNIYVKDGAFVQKGQRLYAIDNIRYKAVRDQAKANLQSAQTQLDRVKRDLDRYIELDEKDAIAKQLLDYAKSDYESAKDRVEVAKAVLSNAETDLSRAVIYAPFSGKIGISMVRQGALVSAGATLLNTISSINPIGVDFQVSEKEIHHFVELQRSTSTLKDSIISLQLPDGSTYDQFGNVTVIDRAVNRNTGTITVRAIFNNPKDILRVGMNANIKVLNRSATPQVVIPYKAVIDQLGNSMVYIVSDSNTAVSQHIQLGLIMSDKVVVKEGLKVGQRVITDGLLNLRPNDKVQIEGDNQ